MGACHIADTNKLVSKSLVDPTQTMADPMRVGEISFRLGMCWGYRFHVVCLLSVLLGYPISGRIHNYIHN